MELFLLTRTTNVGWDQAKEMIVRAEDEGQARRLASQGSRGYEGPGVWMDPAKVLCETIPTDGPMCILIEDYNRG